LKWQKVHGPKRVVHHHHQPAASSSYKAVIVMVNKGAALAAGAACKSKPLPSIHLHKFHAHLLPRKVEEGPGGWASPWQLLPVF